jgi:hypothetical protein
MISRMTRDLTAHERRPVAPPVTMAAVGRQLLWAIVCAPLATGCYAYQSAGVPVLQPGIEVRIELNDLGTDLIDRMLARRAVSLTGRIRAMEGDSIALVVPDALTLSDGSSQVGTRNELALPVRGMRRIEQRVFQKSRTRKAIAVAVTLFSAVVYFTLKSAGSRSPGASLGPDKGLPE